MKIVKCPNCGSNVDSASNFCEYCGADFVKEFSLKESIATSVENLTETARGVAKPLAWGIGLSFLIPAIIGSIAIIGFIILAVFAVSNFGV